MDFDESIGGWTNVHVVLPQPQGWLYSSPTSVTRSRFGCQLRWVHFFWPSPFWPLDDFCWFFLLNLGSTAPNYSRKPLMRSSKAPPNQKNRGQFLPQPTQTHRSWHPNLLQVTLVGVKYRDPLHGVYVHCKGDIVVNYIRTCICLS